LYTVLYTVLIVDVDRTEYTVGINNNSVVWYKKNEHSVKGFPWLFPSTPTCAGIVSYPMPYQHQNLSFVILMSLHFWYYDEGKWCAIKWTKNWWFICSEMWHTYWV